MKDSFDIDKVEFVGWELNSKNKSSPNMVNLEETMDKNK